MPTIFTAVEPVVAAALILGGLRDPIFEATSSIVGPVNANYSIGEPVSIAFSITSFRPSQVQIQSSGRCLFIFVVREYRANSTTGPIVYASSKHGPCDVPNSLILAPHQSYNKTLVWNQTTDSGTALRIGRYEILGGFEGSVEGIVGPVNATSLVASMINIVQSAPTSAPFANDALYLGIASVLAVVAVAAFLVYRSRESKAKSIMFRA